MKQVRKILAVSLIISGFFLLYSSAAGLEGSEYDPVLFEALGVINGTGDNFVIDSSDFPGLKLETSSPLDLRIDTTPGIIIIETQPSTGTSSVEVSMSGLLPETKYYKYQDGYHNLVEFITDIDGKHSFILDVTTSHFIFIQVNKSTKFLSDNATGGDCTSIGVWDAPSKTCTLNRNLSETIQIDVSNITLDGAGYTITGPTTPGSMGIFITGKTGVLLKNIKFVNFSRSIYVANSQSISILDNSFTNSFDAITLSNTHNSKIESNLITTTSTASFQGYHGITLSDADHNVFSNNKMQMNASRSGSGIRQGIVSVYGDDNEYVGNIVDDAGESVQFYDSVRNIFRNGTISKSKRSGLVIYRNATENKVYNNNFIQNIQPFANFYSSTVLNLALPYGGNYWDFYDTATEGCNDSDNNNFCDTSKVLLGGTDAYPWKIPDGWLSVVPEPERDPVIVIPGITGSYLLKNYGDMGEIWPNVAKLVTSITDEFLNDLSFRTDGTENPLLPMKLGDIIREQSGAHVFDYLISDLKTEGYVEGKDLFVFPYDWRKGNAENAILLKNKINEILTDSGGDKVDIVAHSMGGILAKKYIANEGNGKVNKLIFLGTPHLGAPKAFKALMYGDDMGFSKFGIPVLSGERMKIISQNMPAVYELLPSQGYVTKSGGYVTNALDKNNPIILNYLQTKDKIIQSGRNGSMFPFAENIHNELDNLNLTGPEVHNFAGCGGKTVGQITLKQKLSWIQSHFELTDDFDLKYVNGDETVPLISTDATPGAAMHYVKEISHGALPSADGVKESVLAILKGEELPSMTNILTTSSGCGISGKNVSVHSPVEMHIYDDAGNHVGPKISGDVEINIPGVAYDIIDGEKFAFLPDGKNYKITTKATDTGGYDLAIKDQNANDQITATYEWNLVPLATLQAKGEIRIGPNYPASQYALKVDNNGDGTFDKTISANQEVSIKDYLFILRGVITQLNVDTTTKNLLLVKLDKVEKELDKGQYAKMSDKLAKLGEKLYTYQGKLQNLLLQEKNDLVNSINLLLDELLRV